MPENKWIPKTLKPVADVKRVADVKSKKTTHTKSPPTINRSNMVKTLRGVRK